MLIDGKIDEGDEIAVTAAAAAAAPDIVRSILTYATGSIICVCQIALAGGVNCSGGTTKLAVVVVMVMDDDNDDDDNGNNNDDDDDDEHDDDEIVDVINPEHMDIPDDPLANIAAAAASFSFWRLANLRIIASRRLPLPSRLRRL